MASAGGSWHKVKSGKNKGKMRFEQPKQRQKRVHRNASARAGRAIARGE